MARGMHKTAWTNWRPVVRGSKSDSPKYRKPVMAGITECAQGVGWARQSEEVVKIRERLADVADLLHIPPRFDRRKKK